MVDLAGLPAPPGFLDNAWVSLEPGPVTDADVSSWPFSVSLLVKFTSFLSTLRWPECGRGGDVVGVLTLLVGGVAKAFQDDRVVELGVQLGVEDVEGKDREEQVEVEREKRVKEGAPWMTMEMIVTRLRT